jgi:hypothetical protein
VEELDEAVARVTSADGVEGQVNLVVLAKVVLLEKRVDILRLDGIEEIAEIDAAAVSDGAGHSFL